MDGSRGTTGSAFSSGMSGITSSKPMRHRTYVPLPGRSSRRDLVATIDSASLYASIKLVGSAVPCPGYVEARAVANGCPDERQAERDIDRPAEIDGLNGDEPLVVIHGDVGVAPLPVKKGIGGKRACRVDSGSPRPFDGLGDHPLLVAHTALLAGVGIESAHFDAGDAMPKSVLRARSVTAMQERTLAVFMRPGTSLRGTWIVTRQTLIFRFFIIMT